MAAIVQEAIEAGALGFSTSRTIGHRAMDGEPVPGTFAAEDELFGARARDATRRRRRLRARAAGAVGEDLLAPEQEMEWMRRLSDELDLPVSFALMQIDAAPDLWRELMDESLPRTRRRRAGGAAGRGAPVRHAARLPDPSRVQPAGPPTAARGALAARRARSPSWRSRRCGRDPRRGRRRARPDRAVRRHVRSSVQDSLDRLYALGDPPDYEPTPDRTDRGDRRGARASTRSTMLYDLMLEHDAPAPADAAVLQLRRGQPRRHPRDAAAPRRRVGPVRRRRALRARSATRRSPRSCSRTGRATARAATRCRSSTW